MKTGRFHNDAYCFHAIERSLLKEEIKSPLKKLALKFSGGLRGGRRLTQLAKIFGGERRQAAP